MSTEWKSISVNQRILLPREIPVMTRFALTPYVTRFTRTTALTTRANVKRTRMFTRMYVTSFCLNSLNSYTYRPHLRIYGEHGVRIDIDVI